MNRSLDQAMGQPDTIQRLKEGDQKGVGQAEAEDECCNE
jgi:hypothetical protein